MEWIILLMWLAPSVALAFVFLASVPTGWEILKKGNAADPLRREMEKEAKEKKEARAAA